MWSRIGNYLRYSDYDTAKAPIWPCPLFLLGSSTTSPKSSQRASWFTHFQNLKSKKLCIFHHSWYCCMIDMVVLSTVFNNSSRENLRVQIQFKVQLEVAWYGYCGTGIKPPKLHPCFRPLQTCPVPEGTAIAAPWPCTNSWAGLCPGNWFSRAWKVATLSIGMAGPSSAQTTLLTALNSWLSLYPDSAHRLLSTSPSHDPC